MSCVCDGTGFVEHRGDYKSRVTGVVHKDQVFVRRCPEFLRYFELMGGERSREFIADVPVMRGHGVCPAAQAAHEELRSRRTEEDRR